MHPTRTTWRRRLRSLLPYTILAVILAAGLIALDHSRGLETTSAPPPVNANRGSATMEPCGTQLGIAGYSVTLTTASNASQMAATSLGLTASDLAPEFLPITSAAQPLHADPAAQALALDRMYTVHAAALRAPSGPAIVAKLQNGADVSAAEPIWLQSSDKRYLACDYKLQDNATDQTLATTARQALIAHGISAATLDDAATMEYVSLRHFNGRQLLQVAFVRRPVGGTSAVYVALMDPSARAVLAVAQANWYLWG